MGYGEVGSNGSVHWNMNHKESGNVTHSQVDKTKKHPGKGGTPGLEIGEGKPNGNHPGKFRVTARYQNAAQAEKALRGALASLYPNPADALDALQNGLGILGGPIQRIAILDIDLRPFGAVSQGPGDPKDWELRFDW